MSYCRFSIDDTSDVYVFEHVEGYWQIHVASSRRRHRGGVECPKMPEPTEGKPLAEAYLAAWFAAHEAQMAWADECELVPIDLPNDGASFEEPTPGACADRLEELRAAGYHVPQHAIDALREEAAEEISRV